MNGSYDVNTNRNILPKKSITQTNYDPKYKIQLSFGRKSTLNGANKKFPDNRITTTKYNILTFIPKSLFMQFLRAANIYFLIISILTIMNFSPKNPTSMIGTFALVLIATMIKEALEDYKRYKSDTEMNDKPARVYNYMENSYNEVRSADIKMGDLVFLKKDESVPADILLIRSSFETGMCFVDTMNLDGETNLKEKMTAKETMNLDLNSMVNIEGELVCDKPDENLEKWECKAVISGVGSYSEKSGGNNINNHETANINHQATSKDLTFYPSLKQLMLKGCILKNTQYIVGIAVYTGHNTKIMKNAKSPPLKVSNVMKVMNKLLYSVFAFQFILCLVFSICYIVFMNNTGLNLPYLLLSNKDNSINAGSFFIRFLTFLVAYSHLIPISLYVALEIVKILQGKLIMADINMLDNITGKSANARTSDLIEELGQVEFIFSDKTGTLTKNEMEFVKCSVNSKILNDDELGNIRRNINNMDESEEKRKIVDFFSVMAVCHSAYVENGEDGLDGSFVGNNMGGNMSNMNNMNSNLQHNKDLDIMSYHTSKKKEITINCEDDFQKLDNKNQSDLSNGNSNQKADELSLRLKGASANININITPDHNRNRNNSPDKSVTNPLSGNRGDVALNGSNLRNNKGKNIDISSNNNIANGSSLHKEIDIGMGINNPIGQQNNPINNNNPYMNLKYQSSSPDEIALIEGARKVGYTFTTKTASTIEIVTPNNTKQIWELILELPFDSTRKRMSVIVKLRAGSEYILFSKGADSAMLGERMIFSQDHEKANIKNILLEFAKEGLRTLVMAKKKLSQEDVDEYMNQYQQINSSNDIKKEAIMSELFEKIESGFTFVGASAIEDKLQDDVAQTIEMLMNAGIKVWVLTGDKKETAVEIGKTSKLVLPNMDMIDLASPSDVDESRQDFEKKLSAYYKEYVSSDDNTNLTTMKEKGTNGASLSQQQNKQLFLIIDGKSLAYVLADDALSKKFFQIGMLANSVICCRVSPKQKSQVVKLAKSNASWITLAIGDGANDVSMIMEAHIGVGISGKEGTQAVRSADYAIGQFKFLQRLLFIHGRLGYSRISYFIYYYFYKNIILVFTELYFAFFNGFSGQIFFPDMLPLCYNSFWTSWPAIFSYSVERDVCDSISMNFPILYKAGQIKYYFNLAKFWQWIGLAIFHGAIAYFGTLLSLKGFESTDGLTKNHWYASTITFSVVIHIVSYKIFIALKNWNKMVVFVSILSIVFYYLTVLVLCIPAFAKLFNAELTFILYDNLNYFNSYIIIAFLPFIALLPDLFLQFFGFITFPNASDVMFYNEKLFKEKAEKIEKERTMRQIEEKERAKSKNVPVRKLSSGITPRNNLKDLKEEGSLKSKGSLISLVDSGSYKNVNNEGRVNVPNTGARNNMILGD